MTRVVVAMMSHETNTFSPVVTDLARFSRGGVNERDNERLQTRRFRGDCACCRRRGTLGTC